MVAERGTRLVFARHGESEANLLREFSNTGLKHPLTTTGRAQAARLADRLSEHGDVRRVLTSPLLRAQQTAQILAERLDVPVTTDDRLREFDVGDFEGTREMSHWDEFGRVVDAWMMGAEEDRRVGGGESHRDVRARFAPLVDEVAALPGTTVLLGHGGLFLCVLPYVLSNVTVGWALAHPLAPTETVVASHAGERHVCSRWADRDVAVDEVLDALDVEPAGD